jgi:hypothetical protein
MIVVMLPTILAILLDKSNDKCLSFSVFFFNITAVLIDSLDLIHNNIPIINSQIIKNAYIASATGFVFYLIVPLTIKRFYLQVSSFKRASSRAKIKALESNWDINH